MSTAPWLLASGVLLVGGIGPALLLSARGTAAHRLVGLQLVSSLLIVVLILLSLGLGRPDYLIVPLVLVLLSFAGTLVFTRLLGVRDD
ncbi:MULTISPECIES: monovalent cation/H+ antiporter complex subunit F [Nocardia]|uniref:monovalent cation/H+ antiporter complex subunit F n=1 Tax=Nocardia TaxID=1817 RepID=UPI0007A3C9AF|nr:monovalent cation/H+ antiporter complex subunit F [Nocardia pseudovaccinii]